MLTGTAVAGWTLRGAVGSVWLHQGLWSKVLRGRPDHEAIVADVPGVGERRARTVTVGIGVGETVLAFWVLSGFGPRCAAVAQTALLVGMNAGGLVFAHDRIGDPRRMVARNACFLAAIWGAAMTGRSQ